MSPASDPLVASLLSAVQAAPDDVPLRLHLVALLQDRGEPVEAVRQTAAALAIDPGNTEARTQMLRLLRPASDTNADSAPLAGAGSAFAVSAETAAPHQGQSAASDARSPESQTPDSSPLAESTPSADTDMSNEATEEEPDDAPWGVEDSDVTLADVGGMSVAKENLEAAVLAPMRNPELRRLYHQSRRGGVLMYGPPGCGKTFLARAVAGELEARFLAVCLGALNEENAESEIEAVFATAREQAPVLLYLKQLEALGRRGPARRAATGRAVSQLAAELDKGPAGNYGVTVLAASDAPWDVDPVLRRPGRLERTLLVLPPDLEARAVIFQQHLGADAAQVDVHELALFAEGYSGADIAGAAEDARSRAREEGRPVSLEQVRAALQRIEPSADAWLEKAQGASGLDADESAYVGLREYLKSRPR
ncbi:AAA family ATPase [Gephyromycinifex aptenodytis]|uniref:AAA family ATPase n=1 Tax=Gephyromycinifex aptenodytis TaxID=2716227 RepID=UPI001444F9D4|nr:ATP-binding protein [Gephyromycinifex aptenodytis]